MIGIPTKSSPFYWKEVEFKFYTSVTFTGSFDQAISITCDRLVVEVDFGFAFHRFAIFFTDFTLQVKQADTNTADRKSMGPRVQKYTPTPKLEYLPCKLKYNLKNLKTA